MLKRKMKSEKIDKNDLIEKYIEEYSSLLPIKDDISKCNDYISTCSYCINACTDYIGDDILLKQKNDIYIKHGNEHMEKQ